MARRRYKRTCMVKMPLKFINLKKKRGLGRKVGADCTMRAHKGLASLPNIALKEKRF